MNALGVLKWPVILGGRTRTSAPDETQPREIPDIDYVRRAQAGEAEACEVLFRRYAPKINRLVVRMLGDRPDTEDILQEIFLKTFRSINSYRQAAQFSTWIYRIATNTCLNYIKHQSVVDRHVWRSDEEDHDIGTWPDQQDGQMASPESIMLRQELGVEIGRAIAALPTDQRAALVLRDIEGLSYEEIAEILDCPLGTLKSRIARARAACQQRLRAYVH